MHIFHIYACMQIIFESLPVSSSGNVALWIPLLTTKFPNVYSLNDLSAFNFILHIPSLLVISFFFFHKWIPFVISIKTHFKKLVQLGLMCMSADLITVLFYEIFKSIGMKFFPLWFGFFVTTLCLFSLLFYKKREEKLFLQYQDALLLGIVQGCALLPGVSRFATTFVVGVWLGYRETTACAYSFLLEVPLLCAAGIKGLWSFSGNPLSLILFQKDFLAVCLGSTMFSFCVLKLVFVMIKNRIFWLFGWYTLFLAGVAYLRGF